MVEDHGKELMALSPVDWHRDWEIELRRFVVIDVEKVGRHNIIDLSNLASQRAFFNLGPDGYTAQVRENWQYVGRSLKNREVLIMWRGKALMALSPVGWHMTSEIPLAPFSVQALANNDGSQPSR